MPDELKKAMQPTVDLLRQLDEAGVPRPESQIKVVSRLFRHAGIYPLPNLVVELCDRQFADAAAEAVKEGRSLEVAKRVGRVAFCAALPKLSGANNIRDFIACITHAMAMDIIPSAEGARLLYAAQVAHMATTKRPKKRGKSSHTSTGASEAKCSQSTR